jgi:hypothetical protein
MHETTVQTIWNWQFHLDVSCSRIIRVTIPWFSLQSYTPTYGNFGWFIPGLGGVTHFQKITACAIQILQTRGAFWLLSAYNCGPQLQFPKQVL